jgi:hypothetical protein
MQKKQIRKYRKPRTQPARLVSQDAPPLLSFTSTFAPTMFPAVAPPSASEIRRPVGLSISADMLRAIGNLATEYPKQVGIGVILLGAFIWYCGSENSMS